MVRSRFALLLPATLALIAPPAIAQSPEAERHTYREVGGQALSAHVFAPGGDVVESAAAVLLFHGGGWSAGQPEWTFDAARRFADMGMVAVPIEYRLSRGEVTPIEALADVCAAFRWVRDEASALGVDPDRVAGYGVSAGGHLAASAATVGCPEADASDARPGPDLLLLWSPALDVGPDRWFERKLLGRAPATAYSPVEHVDGDVPPTSIVHGDADTLTPLAGAARFCTRLTDMDGTCELHVFGGVGHLLTRNLEYQEGDFDPDPDAVDAGVDAHVDFLARHGFLQLQQRGAN